MPFCVHSLAARCTLCTVGDSTACNAQVMDDLDIDEFEIDLASAVYDLPMSVDWRSNFVKDPWSAVLVVCPFPVCSVCALQS